jgi:hypothetical protein
MTLVTISSVRRMSSLLRQRAKLSGYRGRPKGSFKKKLEPEPGKRGRGRPRESVPKEVVQINSDSESESEELEDHRQEKSGRSMTHGMSTTQGWRILPLQIQGTAPSTTHSRSSPSAPTIRHDRPRGLMQSKLIKGTRHVANPTVRSQGKERKRTREIETEDSDIGGLAGSNGDLYTRGPESNLKRRKLARQDTEYLDEDVQGSDLFEFREIDYHVSNPDEEADRILERYVSNSPPRRMNNSFAHEEIDLWKDCERFWGLTPQRALPPDLKISIRKKHSDG